MKIENQNRKGALNIKSMILLVIAIAVVGGLITANVIFAPLNSSALTSAGAPSWSVGLFGTIIMAIIIMWFVRKIR